MVNPATDMGKSMLIDLHMHSTASDGSLSPTELVRLVHADGVEMMALTDHDTMDGIPRAAVEAERLGMKFIPGVEVSTTWGNRVIHIVGLGLEMDSPGADAFFGSVCAKRDRRGRLIGERFEELGIHGAYEGALSYAVNKDNLSRTHFAHWLLDNGHVDTYQGAFDRYLKQGRPCCVDVDWPELDESISLIHRAGGLAVIAHPGRYNFEESWMLDELFKRFKALGGEAIEVCSGSQSAAANAYMAEVARRMDFLASSGSDWHSDIGVRPRPGMQPQLPPDLNPVWKALGF